jgi:hypothetical protein
VRGDTEFRSPEQEVLKLLDECAELRRTLKSISAQIGRMETRVKRAFPIVAELARDRTAKGAQSSAASISAEQALAEFDRIVALAGEGGGEEAERALQGRSAADLLIIAKELGVSFPKSKPSVRTIREGIIGKVRESILLTRHNPRVRD